MTEYTCSKCNKTFSRKNGYDYHLVKKNPCKPTPNTFENIIKALSDRIVELEIKNNKINILEEKIEYLLSIKKSSEVMKS